jgi:hypothetical protein
MDETTQFLKMGPGYTNGSFAAESGIKADYLVSLLSKLQSKQGAKISFTPDQQNLHQEK